MARKPNKNAIPLTVESVLRLRDEDEEEEENDESALAVRMKRTTDASSVVGSMMLHEAPPRTEDIPEKDSGRVPELSDIEDASHRSQRAGDMIEGALEPLRTEENAPGDSFGAAAIEDSPTFPAFTVGVIREAQALGALDLDRPHDEEDPFRDLFTGIEDVAGAGDESDLFHGLRQALNQAAAVHREACSRSQNELHRYEADLQRATDERNSFRLSLGQREEIKDLRAELAKAYRDQTDLSEQVMILLKAYGLDTGTIANISVSQLQQKIEMIGKLREEVDVIKTESLRWKEGIDRFAAEKETARAQLSSSETQLQKMKEKGLVQARRIEELKARLASVLAKAESDVEKAKADADALVAVYRVDTEAAQVQAREATESADTRAHWVAELDKCRSRRETLEEIHARGFDLAEEIKRTKELEADAEALVFDGDDDDDGSKSGSENGGSLIKKRPLLTEKFSS
ncbi:structural maintenance of chromosomes protein 1-like [Nicotiana tomentosiformis]|uniref:structural maintenance of chromosomes protein 1-like n=1 Tax=Nicotiana tomentosiformis TaxID=4098 RepID=UPI00388CAFC1